MTPACRPAVAAAIAALLATACRPGGIKLTLHNRSDLPLDSVVVLTTGHRYVVGDLPAGGTHTLRVRAEGESHVEVEHGRTDRRRLGVPGSYFEPGYRGTVTAELTPDSVLRARAAIR